MITLSDLEGRYGISIRNWGGLVMTFHAHQGKGKFFLLCIKDSIFWPMIHVMGGRPTVEHAGGMSKDYFPGGSMVMDRKYQFSWDLLGNVEKGRPNLGRHTRIEVYRLMQFVFRDVLEQQYGTEQTDKIFYETGKMAGIEYFNQFFAKIKEFNNFVKELQKIAP